MNLTAICCGPGITRHAGIRKVLLIMRLTSLLLTVAVLHVNAGVMSQSVSLSAKNMSLEKVFSAVTKQTGYVFFYDRTLLKDLPTVSIEANSMPLMDFLNVVMKQQNLKFIVENQTIMISGRDSKNSLPTGIESIRVLPDPPIRIRITDSLGNNLTGATVAIKGKNQAKVIDQGGVISVNVKAGDAIQISFVGYETRTVQVTREMLSADNLLTIVLKPQIASLVEVAVISTGYQTISKERSTGSYATIKRDQLEKPATNIAQRLIGQVAGLQARSLDESGNPVFEIRGQTTLNNRDSDGNLNQNGNPLVVVDGFPIQGDFNTVNPNDVESVTVLKDAAASSIWGARAANGVIVITTKNARKRTPLKVELNAFTSIGAKLDLDYVRPLASSAETVEYEKKAFNNWRIFPGPVSAPFDIGYAFSSAGIALNEAELGFITPAELDAKLEALKKLDNKQQVADYLLSNPAASQINLTLSGGSEKMSNIFSILYEANKSNFKGTDGKRYMLNYRSNFDLAKWLRLDLSAMFQHNKNNNNGVTLNSFGSIADISNMSPYDMLVNPDGSLTNIQQYYTPFIERDIPTASFPYSDWSFNPIQEIANRDYSIEQNQTRLQAALNVRIIPGLTAEVRGQYELGNSYTRNLDKEGTWNVRNTVNLATFWDQSVNPNRFIANLPKGGILQQTRGKAESYNVRGQLNYSTTFGTDHELNLLTGIEWRNLVAQTYRNPTAYGYNEETMGVGNFPNGPGGPNAPIYNIYGSAQTFAYVNSFASTTQRLYSAFGNAAYTYNGKYTASGSYRFDASNLITDDPKYRYAPFYSAGLSWQVKRENFMSNIAWLDQLTARLTYGHQGNYDPTTTFKPLISPSASPNIYINAYTAGFSSFGNPTLRWERTKTWNLGVDFALLNNAIYGKIDLYQKKGEDLLATISIPSIHGATSQRLNNAAMTNKGIEVELGTTRRIARDMTWNGNVTFSYNKNTITDLFVLNYNATQMSWGGAAAYVVGEDANSIWRKQYAGLKDGQPVYYGPGKETYPLTAFIEGDARAYMANMGTLVAPYTLGFTSSFRYKDFGLSFILTGKFGHKFQRLGFNYPATIDGRVLPNVKLTEVNNGDPAKVIPLPSNSVEPGYYSWNVFTDGMSYLIESASHVRMQEVNLSYTLPTKLVGRIGLDRFMVYAQGNNLFTVYANKFDEDPEYPMGTIRPMPRFTFGIRCAF